MGAQRILQQPGSILKHVLNSCWGGFVEIMVFILIEAFLLPNIQFRVPKYRAASIRSNEQRQSRIIADMEADVEKLKHALEAQVQHISFET